MRGTDGLCLPTAVIDICPRRRSRPRSASASRRSGAGRVPAGCGRCACSAGSSTTPTRSRAYSSLCRSAPAAVRVADRRREPVVTRMSDVWPERVAWLWRSYIPMGRLTVVDGPPGVGKSTIVSADIAARVSTGATMPDGSPGTEGGVVILSAEDAEADTIRPRLDAAGADVARVVTLRMRDLVADADDLLILPDDLAELEDLIRREQAVLVIIDPLVAYLSGQIDGHRDQDVRRALARLGRTAERTGAAIVAVRHLRKTPGPAVYRGGGSIGITAAARSLLVVEHHPDEDGVRVLAAAKHNLAARAPSLRYGVVDHDGAGRIEWHGPCDIDADTLLAAAASRGMPGASASRRRPDIVEIIARLLDAAPAAAWSGTPTDLAAELTRHGWQSTATERGCGVAAGKAVSGVRDALRARGIQTRPARDRERCWSIWRSVDPSSVAPDGAATSRGDPANDGSTDATDLDVVEVVL